VAVNALIHHIDLLKRQCELPSAAQALQSAKSCWREYIPAMVQAALADVTLKTTPRPATADDVRELLEALL
jgi:1-propanol dehydrogenase